MTIHCPECQILIRTGDAKETIFLARIHDSLHHGTVDGPTVRITPKTISQEK